MEAENLSLRCCWAPFSGGAYIFPTQGRRRDVPLTMTRRLAAGAESDGAASSAQTGGRTFTSQRVPGQLLETFSIED